MGGRVWSIWKLTVTVTVVAQFGGITAGAQEPGADATWRIAASPEVTIGQVDGPEEYLLTTVREGLLLDDGTIVVRNSIRDLFELRYYDGSGRYLATASRWGQGPFEFRRVLSVMHLPSDSVLVLGQDWRYSVFGSRGERIREGRFDGALTLGLNHDLIDGTHLGVEAVVLTPIQGSGPERSQRAYVIRDFAGATDTVAIVDAERMYVDRDSQPNQGGNAPFSPTALSAAGAGVFWLGSTDIPEIHGYDVDGRRVSTIRLETVPTPVSRADRNRWLDEISARNPRGLRGAEELGFPDALPFWGGLEVDREGNVWVLRYDMPWAEGPQYWDVFNQRGVPVATVAVPQEVAPRCRVGLLTCRLGILDIGVDYLLVLGRGPFDVPQVRKHRLIKE